MVSITLMSRIPVSAPLDVRNRSLAIIESITATASVCCRSTLGLGIVIANVLPPAVVKVNFSTLLVVTAMLPPPLDRIFQPAIHRPAQSFSYRVRRSPDTDLDLALQEKVDLQKALNGEKGKNTQLTKERDNLKTKAGDLQKSNQALEQDVEKKQLENDKLKEKTAYKSIQRMSDNLTAAYNKVAANRIAFLYENLDKAFKELAYEMTKFASIDPDVHAAYRKMVNDFLIKAMQVRMGG